MTNPTFYTEDYLFLRLGEETQRAKRYQRPFSCLMVSVELQHPNGKKQPLPATDEIIFGVGGFLKKNFRSVDVVIKYPLSRFIIILPETALSGARIAAERLRYAADRHFVTLDGVSYKTILSLSLIGYDKLFHSEVKDILSTLEKGLLTIGANETNRIFIVSQG